MEELNILLKLIVLKIRLLKKLYTIKPLQYIAQDILELHHFILYQNEDKACHHHQ